jgi:hypothetical protein
MPGTRATQLVTLATSPPRSHLQGIYKNTTLKQDIASLKFIRPDKGRIRTRLLQVVAKEAGAWKIVTYHNVDVKPGIPFP